MSLKSLAVLGVAISLSACLDSGDPYGGQQNYGFVVLETALEEGVHVTQPTAIFYRTGLLQLPSSTSQRDTCIVAPYSPDPGAEPQYPPTLSAGPLIELTLSGTVTQLTPNPLSTILKYDLASGEAVPFQPGDTATVEIPGSEDGFPSWTIKAKTAEPFTFTAVPVHDAPQILTLQWQQATSFGSRMVVSLRYALEGGGMAQLYCELVDDGRHDIDETRAEGWRTAANGEREAVFARWRITGEAQGESALLVLSSLQVPTPTTGPQ